ncbi:hypothetical protein ACU686_04155 [Yinghuangia aomiensis]
MPLAKHRTPTADPAPPTAGREAAYGLLGRLGAWSAAHLRLVAVLWLALVAGLGAFAPQVTSALAGAGWQANGSESVHVRELAQQHFGGNASSALQVVVSSDRPVDDPAVRQVLTDATARLKADSRIADVVPPQPGATISPDGRTAILLAAPAPTPTTWCAPPTTSRDPSPTCRTTASPLPRPARPSCGATSTPPTTTR